MPKNACPARTPSARPRPHHTRNPTHAGHTRREGLPATRYYTAVCRDPAVVVAPNTTLVRFVKAVVENPTNGKTKDVRAGTGPGLAHNHLRRE